MRKHRYPPRAATHPEVLSRGVLGSTFLRTLNTAGIGLKSTGHAQSYCDATGDSDETHGPLLYALARWVGNNKPIYYLDRDLAETLTHTEVPMESFSLPVWIPDDGMYLVMPPIFWVSNPHTGKHAVEGIYLTRDTSLVKVDAEGNADWSIDPQGSSSDVLYENSPGYKLNPSISIVGIGASHGTFLNMPDMRDDAIVTAHLSEGCPITRDVHTTYGGIPEILRVVCNLLYALQRTRGVEQETVQPELSKKALKRKPGRTEKLMEEGGRSLLPYKILRLSKRVRMAVLSEGPRSGRKLRHQKVVSGHFHKYWVLDAEDEVVLDTKQGKGGDLKLIEFLLAPYIQGAHLPVPPKTVVVKP